MENLAGKIVFITGASSGIGKACAEEFAREKADLILTARRKSKLDSVADELRNKYGIKILTLESDVRNFTAVTEQIINLPAEWIDIDILINNAGLARGFDKLYEGNVDDWEEMIDTNIKGLLYVTRNILPGMVERGNGHIINIGSVAGHEAYAKGNVYCATKYAVNGLTQAIRLDVLDKNIRVSTVDPGMVYTEFSEVRFSGDSEKAGKVYDGIKPLYPEDIAEAVLFCASRPPHVNINEIIITTQAQASSTQIFRKK